MIDVKRVVSDGDLEAWVAVKNAVVPNEPTTAELVRRDAEPDRRLYLAALDGELAGSGIVDRSHFGGKAFVAVRVLPYARRRGVGSTVMSVCSGYARSLGLEDVNAFVYADEPHSLAFAEKLGLREVDYQLEQRRIVGSEGGAQCPGGVTLVPLCDRREELLRAVWPIALEGYQDMPLPGGVTYELDAWLREEATRPDGSFVAYEGTEPVGYAGLLEHAAGADVAEHGLTVVRRDRRGRGLGKALKRAQLEWASAAGVRELVTWTQRGNEAMQALNRSLGYSDRAKVITFQGPL